MHNKPIRVEVIQATRPHIDTKHGLVTLQLDYPLYLHTELLTHRRFARNASSARAMSTDRYSGMGYYEPDTFLEQGIGMRSSVTPVRHQWLARGIYRATMCITELAAKALERLHVSKEQRNRLIPPTKMIRGIVTGTEAAWHYFLSLRNNVDADMAMQDLARKIKYAIDNAHWNYATTHTPFYPRGENYSDEDARLVAAARIARVSYAREKGKDDLELAISLLTGKHYSPFEHSAAWVEFPVLCAFNSGAHDRMITYGWESKRP